MEGRLDLGSAEAGGVELGVDHAVLVLAEGEAPFGMMLVVDVLWVAFVGQGLPSGEKAFEFGPGLALGPTEEGGEVGVERGS